MMFITGLWLGWFLGAVSIGFLLALRGQSFMRPPDPPEYTDEQFRMRMMGESLSE